jgi:hypothetical protein
VFETFLPSARRRSPLTPELVGLLTVLYALALVVLVAVGPFVLSVVGNVPFGTALQRVVVVAAAGYVLGMALLLR